jgi:hypothetical protein
VHVAVGALGRVLGGTGDDYVRANAIVGLLGWLAAVLTLVRFARREGGDRAALLAVAAFTGSAFASASFSVNLPSGWLFVVTPWAIDAFLRGRLVAATLLTALACYTHLGGFLTAPFGLALAAFLPNDAMPGGGASRRCSASARASRCSPRRTGSTSCAACPGTSGGRATPRG